MSLALGHDALFLHAGGSPSAYLAIKNWGAAAFDCVNGPYEGTLFWRDKERRRNMGLEHSVLTSGDTISELLPTYGYRMEHREDFSYPVQFLDEGQTAQGDPGTKVSVTFSTYKTGVFTYDPETGMYAVEEYGKPLLWTATRTGRSTVKNVLVLRTDRVQRARGRGRAAEGAHHRHGQRPAFLRRHGAGDHLVQGSGQRPHDLPHPRRPARPAGGGPLLCEYRQQLRPGDGKLRGDGFHHLPSGCRKSPRCAR